MEQHRQEEEALPQPERPLAGAGGDDLQRAVGRRDRHVGGVETQRGRAVEVEIDVVDQMQAPQQRHFMGQHVPEIDSVIEHQERHRVAPPGRERKPLRQADAPPFHHAGERLHQRRLDELHHRQRAGAEHDVAQAALRLVLGRFTQPPSPFGQHDPERRGGHQGRGEQGTQLGHPARTARR